MLIHGEDMGWFGFSMTRDEGQKTMDNGLMMRGSNRFFIYSFFNFLYSGQCTRSL
jgi:hypothetical protein